MKRLISLIFCLVAMILLFGTYAMASDTFKLPSAGAETILRNIPANYIYDPDWKTTADRTPETPAAAEDAGGKSVTSESAETDDSQDNADNTDNAAADTTAENTGAAEDTAAEETAAAEEPPAAATTPVATNNRVVCIDAGHQSKGNNSPEPIGPGASETKAKVAGGTRGVATGVPEYQLTLDVALKLQSELQSRGYTVVMCRTGNDVNISNSERAAIANNAGAGAFLRLHGNGAGSADVSGAETLAPSSSNPYCSGIASQSQALSKAVLDGLCAATGAKNRGVKIADNMSGINWSRVPVTIVEMGYMTNPAEDASMQDASYQAKLAKGMADGVDKFFGL